MIAKKSFYEFSAVFDEEIQTGKLMERRQSQLRVKNELQCVALVVIDDYLLDDFVGKLKFDSFYVLKKNVNVIPR